MMKYVKLFALFLLIVFCTSCKEQNKTDLPKNNAKSETKDAVTPPYGGAIRTIKQDRNGNIWITSWDGVFRYDGKMASEKFLALNNRKGIALTLANIGLLQWQMGNFKSSESYLIRSDYEELQV